MHTYTVHEFYDEFVGKTAYHVRDEVGRIHATVWDEELAYKIRRLLIEADA